MCEISKINSKANRLKTSTNKINISWVRIMWILVLFDLPVTTKKQRKLASNFRKELLDKGFLMAQFSVYYKLAGTREVADRINLEIQSLVPENGKVNILTITDKQYENMVCIVGKEKVKTPVFEQLLLF